jgi:hypothetical protein
MAHDSRNPHTFVDGAGNVASGDQVMDNFDAVWGGLDTAIAGVAASLDAPVITVAAAARQVRDIGESNQIRAGRVLTAADFTNIGLAAPAGLWNLSNVNDSSGNARALTNKGTVPFGPGITGAATEAAVFAGSTAQALYIADTGAADPFRIKTGSWGCWFWTAKRGTAARPLAKHSATVGQFSWGMQITSGNVANVDITGDGTSLGGPSGTTDVCDARWHHVVGTYDGTRLRLYVDGALEGVTLTPGTIFAGNGPINIGSYGADGATAANVPHFGRVDEAFVTSDVLSPEQVLNLYCARITHPLGAIPKHTIVTVTRRKRGPALSGTDFPTLPVRLHNFVAGSGSDAGTGGVTISPVGGGTIVSTAAPDGTRDGAQSFSGAHTGLGATDAGLPSGTASRSFGGWFKTATSAVMVIIGWGTSGTADTKIYSNSGTLTFQNGADGATGPGVTDGLWHHVAVVEDNAAADGVKRKGYLDGRLVASSTVLNSVTLAGANRFRVGANVDGTSPFTGQISRAFVYAGALTPEQVRSVYSVGGQALAGSPKAEGDHIEALESSGVLAHFDGVEGCDIIDLSVVG